MTQNNQISSNHAVAWVLTLFCLILPVMALLASKGVVPLLYGTVLLTILCQLNAKQAFAVPDRILSWSIVIFLGWCAIATAWSPEPSRGLHTILKLAPLYAAGLYLIAVAGSLADREKERALCFLAVGWCLSLGLVVVEIYFGSPLFNLIKGHADTPYIALSRMNRGVTALTILVWPIAALLLCKTRSWIVAIPLLVLTLLLPNSQASAAVLGLVVGLMGLGLCLLHRQASRLVLFATIIGIFVISPLGTKYLYEKGAMEADWLQLSARHRIHIWDFTVERFSEKPLIGWGFDASSRMDNGDAKPFKANRKTKSKKSKNKAASVNQQTRVGGSRKAASIIPSHPHNAALQVLLELGIVGAVLAFFVLSLIIRKIQKLPDFMRFFATAQFLTITAVALTAYGFWQSQWQALILSSAVTIVLTGRLGRNGK
ncbi:MAG: O-antigen ligase family protein [Pseudomonadota bacterium]